MREPLVSVIIPVYNTERYIARAVQSVLEQSYTAIEVILVNDGSTDASEEVCKEFEQRYSRVNYFSQMNKGVASARNLGINIANGEYILFLDSDDTWKSNLVERVIECFQDTNCDMVRFGFLSHAPDVLQTDKIENAIYTQKEIIKRYFADGTIYRNLSVCWGGAYKRSIIEKGNIHFDERLAIGEDGKFVLQYSLLCEKIQMLDEYLYDYYPIFEDRENATSRNTKAIYDEYELCFLEFELIYGKWDAILSDDDKEQTYGGFVDRTIGRLVRLAAYTPMKLMPVNYMRLKNFVTNEAVQKAIIYYRPKRKTDSKAIPWAIKNRFMFAVWYMLRSKRSNYFKMYGKKMVAQSIWKNGPIIRF